jgi:glycosyltransferase involved in cell wall biosynthesis
VRTPLVSIIIPTYNSAKLINETLASVFAQSYKNNEIIIVDDGSTDNTLALLEQEQTKIRVISQKNNGACAARNKGFGVSKGEYIQFIDADDLLSPNKIADQVKVLEQSPLCIANGRWGRFYSDYPFSEDIQWGPHESLQKDLDPIEWLYQNHMSQTACWLTPRYLIEQAGPWDQRLTQNQDGEFFTRVLAKAKQVIYTPESKVYYRSSFAGSVSKNAQKSLNIESRYKTCLSFEKELLNLEDSGRTKLAVANKYQEFVYSAYPYRKDLVQQAEDKIKQLGGSNWAPIKSGNLGEISNRILGWKRTAALRQYIKSFSS